MFERFLNNYCITGLSLVRQTYLQKKTKIVYFCSAELLSNQLNYATAPSCEKISCYSKMIATHAEQSNLANGSRNFEVVKVSLNMRKS